MVFGITEDDRGERCVSLIQSNEWKRVRGRAYGRGVLPHFLYFIQKGDDVSRCLVRLLASTGPSGACEREMEKGASVGLRGLLAVFQTASRCARS
jgi:hypothetical protein